MRTGKSRVSTYVLLKVYTVLYPVRVGESRVFDRSLTKSMHCIIPCENTGVEGFDKGLT